jgi:hypothetical protein
MQLVVTRIGVNQCHAIGCGKNWSEPVPIAAIVAYHLEGS